MPVTRYVHDASHIDPVVFKLYMFKNIEACSSTNINMFYSNPNPLSQVDADAKFGKALLSESLFYLEQVLIVTSVSNCN